MTLSQESRNWELDQQISEGTAIYVQMKSFELIDKKFGLQFRKIWTQRMIDNLDDSKGVDGIVKWRHYAVGSMICDYLDRHMTDENWKVSLQSQIGQSMLINAIVLTELTETNLQARGQEITNSPDGKDMQAKAKKLISEYLEEITKIKNQLGKFRFQIEIANLSKDCSAGGVSERTYYLPDGGTLGLNYSGAQKCGNEYKSSFINMPVLLNSKSSTSFGLDSMNIWVNLAEFQIQEGQYKFNNLKIESKTFTLQSSVPGKITFYDSQIQILFDK